MKYIIVGFGNIGHKRQIVLGNKCVATVDNNQEVKATYKDYKKVPLDIFDAAVLTIPQQVKFEMTKYFLSNAKHVLVEKPLIITLNQAKELQKISKQNKVIWYTSYNHRFEPNIIKIQKLLDNGIIGKFYHARFVYSFGNIKERLGTWRETEYGVLEEIAPHTIDFTFRFFGYHGRDFKDMVARKVESNIFDHWLYSTHDNKVIIENSAVVWKNIFSIDIYGSRGSLHMYGLRKWGKSELIIRKRVLPSGVPTEKKSIVKSNDISWEKDFKDFEDNVSKNQTSYKNDLEMSIALAKIVLDSKSKRENKQYRLYKKILKEAKNEFQKN